MLNQVSWTTFFEIVILLAAVYYIFILFRYYSGDIRQLAQRKPAENGSRQIPEALRYEQAEPIAQPINEQHYDQEIPAEDEEAKGLIDQLKQCIHTAADKPFAPAVLIPQVKKIFRDNPQAQHSPHRDAINELVVQECEKTGTALLTEEEVDQWWSDQ